MLELGLSTINQAGVEDDFLLKLFNETIKTTLDRQFKLSFTLNRKLPLCI